VDDWIDLRSPTPRNRDRTDAIPIAVQR